MLFPESAPKLRMAMPDNNLILNEWNEEVKNAKFTTKTRAAEVQTESGVWNSHHWLIDFHLYPSFPLQEAMHKVEPIKQYINELNILKIK